MTHYSENPGHVRVDFFKPDSGKWYMTEVIDMSEFYNHGTVFDAVRLTLAKTRHGEDAEKRWVIVVLEPYHKNAYPVMLTPGRASYEPYPEYRPMVAPVGPSADLLKEHRADGLMTPSAWCRKYGICLGMEAWSATGRSFEEPIDQDTFLELASTCTVRGEYALAFNEELHAWKTQQK